MFDIQAKGHPIKITNIFYQGLDDDVTIDVDIYTKEYTHFGWSDTAEKWTHIGEATLSGQGVAPGEATLLPFNTFDAIRVKSWHRQGFYIQTKNCGSNGDGDNGYGYGYSNDYDNDGGFVYEDDGDCNKLVVWTGEHYAENQYPFVEDDTARVLEGCAMKSLFNNVAGRCLGSRGGHSQTFWGGFRYIVLEKEEEEDSED